MTKKILCICAVGVNRSKYLAEYLREKGYETRYGGVDYRDEEYCNPLKQEDIDWADILIVVRERLEPILKEKFSVTGKKLIVLEVTDSKRLIPEEMAHLRDLSYEEFQEKWTRPKLREAIEKYLPL